MSTSPSPFGFLPLTSVSTSAFGLPNLRNFKAPISPLTFGFFPLTST